MVFVLGMILNFSIVVLWVIILGFSSFCKLVFLGCNKLLKVVLKFVGLAVMVVGLVDRNILVLMFM